MIGKDISRNKSGDLTDFVKEWNERLTRGIKRRRREEDRWDQNEEFENMSQWDGSLGKYDEVTVNKLGAYVRNYVAQVSYNNPRVKLTPKTADGWEPIPVPVAGPGGQPKLDANGQVVVREVIPVKAREALINDCILAAPMMNLQQTSGLLTKAGVIGQGYLKVGYTPIFKTAPEPESEQVVPFKDGKLDLGQYATNPIDGSLVEKDNGRLVTRNEIPVWEDFFIKWVPYRNLIIDPDGGNYWDDHRWVCEEDLRVLADVKADPLLKNTSDLRASGTRVDDEEKKFSVDEHGSDWSEPSKEEGEEPRDVVRLFYIYDMMNEEFIVIADGHGKELRRVSWTELKIADHPYSDYRPDEIMGEFYQRPSATDLVPINEWYNISRQMELRAMKRANRKVLARKGALDTANLELLTNDDDMAWVEVDITGHSSLSDVFIPFNPPTLNNDVYANTQIIGADFAEVGGQTDEARGKATADSATQVNAMEQYTGGRIGKDRKVLAETWRRAFKKLNDFIDANMTKERAVALQSTDGETFQGLIDLDMIAGDVDVSVDFQELAETNTQMQNAGKTQILQIMGQAPFMFTSETLVRGWLEPFGVKDENFVQAIAEAAQMQMAMLQQQAQPDGPVPEAGAPQNEAQAISQAGAGSQVPRMSGSR